MKKIIAIIVSMIFVFSMTAVSFAAEKKEAAPAAPKAAEKKEAAPAEKKEAAPKAAKKQVTGDIKSIDKAAKTITVVKKVKGKDEETVIAVDDKMLADLKDGDKVTVHFTAADGKNTAKSVKKAAAKAEKKEAAPAEKKAPEKKEAAPAAPKAPEKKEAAPAAPKAPEKKKAAGY